MKRLLLLCGLLYPIVWVTGLLVVMPDISLDDTSTQIWEVVNGNHRLGVHSLLVHGVAGVLLLLIASSGAAQRTQRTGRSELGVLILWTGVIAGMISLVQFVLEQVLVFGWFGTGDSSARTLWLTISTIDGIKMFALAGLVLALGYIGGPKLGFPTWVRLLSVSAALALVISGVGYTFSTSWALYAATVSLPLLLLSVTTSSVLEARRDA